VPDLFAADQDYITRSDKPHLRVRLIPQWTAIHDDGNLVPMQGTVQLQIRRDFLTAYQQQVYERAQSAAETVLFIGSNFDEDWIDVMLARYEVTDNFDALAKAATLLLYEGFDPTGFEKDDNA